MEDTDPMYHQTVFAQTFPSGLSGDSFLVIFYSNSSANHGHTTYYDPQPQTEYTEGYLEFYKAARSFLI